MSKRAAVIFLAVLVAVLPFLGFPGVVRTALFVVSGFIIAAITYFSSVTYCSNCKKLINAADRVFEEESFMAVSEDVKKIE
jgi:hypothetical protein